MSFQTATVEPIPPMVSVWTVGWGWWSALAGANCTSGTYGTANQGVWNPVYVPTVCVAKRMWWANGSTVDAGYNVEAGIYRDGGYKPGAKLITTGSTAQGTASQVQFADITDTTLTPGLWWLYISCSTVSATFFRVSVASLASTSLTGFQQASIGPGSAPATATPVERIDQQVYLFGFSTTTIT